MNHIFVPIAALVFAVIAPSVAWAQGDLRKPAGKEWLTIGGDWHNTRYSTLNQINRNNVKNLKGAWVVHLGSGLGLKYSMEGTPIVKDGIMYIATGNDDVYALDAKTGALIWEHKSGIDQAINTVCCGWDNRGVAVGEGKVFVGQLDGTFVALDARTGNLLWQTLIGKWQDGYTITAAPLYYKGVVYTGISGGDREARGKLAALDAKTGKELWHFWTVPGPGELGCDTWPSPNDPDPKRAQAYLHGGATIWQTPADRSGSRPHLFHHRPARAACHRQSAPTAPATICSAHRSWRCISTAPTPGTSSRCTTISGISIALVRWSCLTRCTMAGFARASPEACKTGWIYILDRTNGKPLDRHRGDAGRAGARVAPLRRRNPFRAGDALMPQCPQPLEGWVTKCIFGYLGTHRY